MKKYSATFGILLTLSAVVTSCGGSGKPADGKWLSADDVCVAIDETFRPIMEEEIDIFSKKHISANVCPVFCNENEALRLLMADSVRCCIATRKLSEKEQAALRANSLPLMQTPIATDAFALIVNKNNPDTLITLDEIKQIVTGRLTRWEQLAHTSKKGELQLVFDANGSSTMRYMRDSLNAGEDLSGNLFAQGSNQAVIEAVRENPDIIGVVGTDWLKQKGDSAMSSFRHLDVNVMMVSRHSGDAEDFYRPYQYYIATGDYPLLRTVYVMTTDPRTTSMVKNFYFFLKGQDGQKVICNNSQLLPRSQVQVRNVSVK
ncbi:MAG: PstS family phosphate ABC transporter substrate-binding protein [Alloprevotella sp.]